MTAGLWSEAVSSFREANDKGHVLVARQLASAHHHGLSIPKNKAEALRLYRQAAEKGDKGAMVSLAKLLREDQPTASDEAEALRWSETARRAYRTAAGEKTSLRCWRWRIWCKTAWGSLLDSEAKRWADSSLRRLQESAAKNDVGGDNSARWHLLARRSHEEPCRKPCDGCGPQPRPVTPSPWGVLQFTRTTCQRRRKREPARTDLSMTGMCGAIPFSSTSQLSIGAEP